MRGTRARPKERGKAAVERKRPQRLADAAFRTSGTRPPSSSVWVMGTRSTGRSMERITPSTDDIRPAMIAWWKWRRTSFGVR